jgi:hypothetical protein
MENFTFILVIPRPHKCAFTKLLFLTVANYMSASKLAFSGLMSNANFVKIGHADPKLNGKTHTGIDDSEVLLFAHEESRLRLFRTVDKSQARVFGTNQKEQRQTKIFTCV